MISKRILAEEQYLLIRECHQNGLTDYRMVCGTRHQIGNFIIFLMKVYFCLLYAIVCL